MRYISSGGSPTARPADGKCGQLSDLLHTHDRALPDDVRRVRLSFEQQLGWHLTKMNVPTGADNQLHLRATLK